MAVGIAILALMLFAFMQLFPASETNPETLAEINAPPAVATILRRSCYDCHSNQTHWRWYSRVAPMSWVIARHVREGRQELNFSEWTTYYPQTRRRKLQWIGRAVDSGKMPPWSYLLLHPKARLTPADRAALDQWIELRLLALSGAAPAQ